MADQWYTLSANQKKNLASVRDRRDISTIAAVDLEALRLVRLRESNQGTEVWLTDRGRVALFAGRVSIEGL